MSRGAAASTAIEQDKRQAAAIERLAAEWTAPVTVVARDVFAALPRLEGRFDLVYADPPYEFERYGELLEAVAPVAEDGALVAVEHRTLAVDGWPLAERGSEAADGQRPRPNALQAVRDARYGEVTITFFRT